VVNLIASEKTKEFFYSYHERHYLKGDQIISPDEPNDLVYYLVSGRIKKYSLNYKGEEIILTVFRPGSFLPIDLAIGQKLKNRYFFAADTDIAVRVAPAKDVTEMLANNPDVALSLLHRVNRGLHEFQNRSLSLMTGNALNRVAYEIYIEGKNFGRKISKTDTCIDLSERGIASRTGLTRETVNREIRKLKEAGAVSVKHGSITIKDLNILEKKLYKKLI
jgi:CRP/FNR family transcriptional regulator